MKVTRTDIVTQTDVDECEEFNDCQQMCNNTKGSYTCGCNEGFSLAENGRSCTGKMTVRTIIFLLL